MKSLIRYTSMLVVCGSAVACAAESAPVEPAAASVMPTLSTKAGDIPPLVTSLPQAFLKGYGYGAQCKVEGQPFSTPAVPVTNYAGCVSCGTKWCAIDDMYDPLTGAACNAGVAASCGGYFPEGRPVVVPVIDPGTQPITEPNGYHLVIDTPAALTASALVAGTYIVYRYGPRVAGGGSGGLITAGVGIPVLIAVGAGNASAAYVNYLDQYNYNINNSINDPSNPTGNGGACPDGEEPVTYQYGTVCRPVPTVPPPPCSSLSQCPAELTLISHDAYCADPERTTNFPFSTHRVYRTQKCTIDGTTQVDPAYKVCNNTPGLLEACESGALN